MEREVLGNMLFLGQTLANAVPISPPPLAGITTPDPLRNEVPGVQPRRYAWGSWAFHSDFDVLTRLYPLGCRLPHLYIYRHILSTFLPLSLTHSSTDAVQGMPIKME